MEISGTLSVNVTKVLLKADKKNDGQQIEVYTELKLTPEQAEKGFGEGFHRVAFACMHDFVDSHDDGDATIKRFGYSSKKAPKWMTASLHHVDLWGTKQKTQPEILKIVAGDNEAAVTVHIRFIFDTNRDPALIGAIGCKSGQLAKVKLKPVNLAAIPAAKAA